MLDVRNESLISITEAARHIPGNPHITTMYRWLQRGVRGGIRLETALVGGRRFTSHEAVQRFIDRLSGPPCDATQPRTPRQRERAAQKANEELDNAGW